MLSDYVPGPCSLVWTRPHCWCWWKSRFWPPAAEHQEYSLEEENYDRLTENLKRERTKTECCWKCHLCCGSIWRNTLCSLMIWTEYFVIWSSGIEKVSAQYILKKDFFKSSLNTSCNSFFFPIVTYIQVTPLVDQEKKYGIWFCPTGYDWIIHWIGVVCYRSDLMWVTGCPARVIRENKREWEVILLKDYEAHLKEKICTD